MKDKIFLIDHNRELRALEMQPYDSEDLLQRLLSDYPDLLAGYQMNEADPRRWLLVAREMGIADEPSAADRWSLDHLFLDQDGVPTLIEVKRASDTRIRREVVGQMFDYAANALLHWSPELVKERFESTCQARGTEPKAEVARLLEAAIEQEEVIEGFWERVVNNLKTGRVRLVFVADEIPRELRRIIEFLNGHMRDVEVLGVELRQYVGPNVRTFVPRIIGQTSAAEQVKAPAASWHWDESSFLNALASRKSPAEEYVARCILEWAHQQKLRILPGKGADGSLVPVLDYPPQSQQLFGIWTSGTIEFLFQYYRQPPFNTPSGKRELMERLNEIAGLDLTETHVSKRPNRPLALFADDAKLSRLLEVYEWFIEQIRQNAQ